MSHSPTPWRIVDQSGQMGEEPDYAVYGGPDCIMQDASYYPSAPSREDAEFIVKVVNAHDELVAALAGMTKLYVSLVNCGDCGFWDAEEEDPVKASRAALAKAGAL
jgi:hypothetical protein